MNGWRQLEHSLDAAASRGETIRFWWRDDDAGRDCPALVRLLDMAEQASLPLALAVIPDWLEPNAQALIAASAEVTVLQHGFTHANHAAEGQKSIELGGRDLSAIVAELKKGFTLLQDAFGAAFTPLLVPPWNRIDKALHPHLRDVGYLGLSVFGERLAAEISPGVALINTHLDPIDWRGTRGFVGDDVLLERLTNDLTPDEPIGLLSHHLAMDEACWAFFDQLFVLLSHHPAARLCQVPDLVDPLSLPNGHAA